jgi:GNAT superfamily N-acetyltransferase
VVEYDAGRRADVADLMLRVWGKWPDEAELEWFYEHNPVRPASVLLAEEDGRVVGSAAISFQRMAIGGDEVEVGTAVHLATDPAFERRGIFSTLQAANEERARELGVRLLLTVPTPASAAPLVQRLGWTRLPSLRVWARVRALRSRPRAARVERFDRQVTTRHLRGPARGVGVVRDAAWLNWRFADSPRAYSLLAGNGYAVVGRRGRAAVVAAVEGPLLADAAAAAGSALVLAAPPPWERARYALAGFVPTPKTFTLLGKELSGPLPERPHLELGDLDFT